MSARIPDHAGRPIREPGMLIAFGADRDSYLLVRQGRGWFRLAGAAEWAPLELETQLPGLGGEVLTGERRALVLERLGEPSP